MNLNRRQVIGSTAAMLALAACGQDRSLRSGFSTQLNWFHDPTFVAQYRLLNQVPGSRATEGGAAISPLAIAEARSADFAICGIDIFLEYLAVALNAGKQPALRAVFCDFVRNPVGWVLHPDRAAAIGINVQKLNEGDTQTREALLAALRAGTIKVGDKTGTETTAILESWLKATGLFGSVRPISVGFDSGVVLDNPALLFPVYVNEEPYKLQEKIGKELAILDPALDGVRLYGNIIVSSTRTPAEDIASYAQTLRQSWDWVRGNRDEAVSLLGKYYKGVAVPTMSRQITKTVELAFDQEETKSGAFDVSPGGMLAKSLKTLASRGGPIATLDFAKVTESFYHE